MVRPVPAVLFENLRDVLQVARGALAPANRAELADVDGHIVSQLKIPHRLQFTAQRLFVVMPSADDAGIGPAILGAVHALVRESVGAVHVRLVHDDARNVHRPDEKEAAGIVPLVHLDRDGGVAVDLADRPRGAFLQRPVVVAPFGRRTVLARLIDQVIRPDRLIPDIAPRDVSPHLDKEIGILRLEEHAHALVLIPPARRRVQIDAHPDAELLAVDQDLVQRGEAAVDPLHELGRVAVDIAHGIPVARHLVADQVCVPRGQGLQGFRIIRLPDHRAAQALNPVVAGRDRRRIAHRRRVFDALPRVEGEGQVVDPDRARAVLQTDAQHRVADIFWHLERIGATGPVAAAGGAADIRPVLAGRRRLEAEHALHAVPAVRRDGDILLPDVGLPDHPLAGVRLEIERRGHGGRPGCAAWLLRRRIRDLQHVAAALRLHPSRMRRQLIGCARGLGLERFAIAPAGQSLARPDEQRAPCDCRRQLQSVSPHALSPLF